MNVRRIALCLAACLLAAGCRQDPYLDVHIELLNAAKRSLENRVNELEYEYKVKQEELQRLQAENERLRERSGVAPQEPRGGIEIQPPAVELPSRRERRQGAEKTEELTPPKVENGIPTEPSVDLPPTPPARSSERSPAPPPPASSGRAPALDPSDPRITHIEINAALTRGGNWDQQPGDDGVAVVFEPRNREGKYVPLAGPVSVVVLDPAEQQAEQKRVARWDLDAAEVDRQMRNSTGSQGINLMLPWPDQPPKHRRLRLFVRYVTADGRKLEADREIVVETAQRPSHDWTTSSSPRADAPQRQQPIDVARPEWQPYR